MDKLNIHYFYGLGFALGQVRCLASTHEKLNTAAWSSAVGSAIDWSKNCAASEITVITKTKKAAAALGETLGEFSKVLGQDRDTTVVEIRNLCRAIDDFYNVFDQESQDTHCFVVTSVGAYAVTALLQNASSHLSAAAQKVVTPKVKEDFDKAGECLALDLYTACGFHAMRAVEAEARIYHEEVTGVDLTDVPLGTLIYGDQKKYPNSGLRTQHTKEGNSHEKPLGLIVSLLSQINAIYRRPIMHPEMALRATDAKFVFDTAAIAISAMVTDRYAVHG